MFSTFENEWNKIENLYNNYCYNENDKINFLSSKSLIIWGTGKLAISLMNKVSSEKIESRVKAFCSNAEYRQSSINSIPVIPQKLMLSDNSYKKDIIIIATEPEYNPTPVYEGEYWDQIYLRCIENGFHDNQIFRCNPDLSIKNFYPMTIEGLKRYYYDGFKLAYNLAKTDEDRNDIIRHIHLIVDFCMNRNFTYDYFDILKYQSCRYIEDYYVRFDGNYDEQCIRFCCAHIDTYYKIPSLLLSDSLKRDFLNIDSLRNRIRAENIAFSLFGEKMQSKQRKYTNACLQCNVYVRNNWYSALSNKISHITLGCYPAPCQSKCIYCDVHNTSKGKYIKSLHEKGIKRILDLSQYLRKKFSQPWVSFRIITGEISIHPLKNDILQVVGDSYAQYGTNCFLFDKQISKTTNFGLYFSIDSGTDETWRKIKGVDNFQDAFKNLKNYASFVRRKNDIVIKYILIPGVNDNLNDYASFNRILDELEISSFIMSCDYSLARNTERDVLISSVICMYKYMCSKRKKVYLSALSFSFAEALKIYQSIQ